MAMRNEEPSLVVKRKIPRQIEVAVEIHTYSDENRYLDNEDHKRNPKKHFVPSPPRPFLVTFQSRFMIFFESACLQRFTLFGHNP